MKTSGKCETYPLLSVSGDKITVDPRMDPETEARLRAVAERLKGKELFPEKNARAREMLAGLNQKLPHKQFRELFPEKPDEDKKE